MAHQLNSSWTFYYQDKAAEGAENVKYEDYIHKIGKFSTIEEFWTIFSHIMPANRLTAGMSVHMFRNDGMALWESETNKNGGSFRITIPKTFICIAWETLLMSLIGEMVCNDISGVVISNRKKLAIVDVWHLNESEIIISQIIKDIQQMMSSFPLSSIDYRSFSSIIAEPNQNTRIVYNIGADGVPVKKLEEKKNKR